MEITGKFNVRSGRNMGVSVFIWVLCGSMLGLVLSTAPTIATTTTLPKTTTADTPAIYCPMFNKSCDKCVASVKCMYCYVDNTCLPYPVGSILPKTSRCPFSKTRWSNCLINFEALLISMGVLAGIFLLSCSLCVYFCCCRKNKRLKYMAEEIRFERQKEERRAKSDERKQERQLRNDEIRKKYGIIIQGLFKEENPYTRFDA